MILKTFSYNELLSVNNVDIAQQIETELLEKGIVAISNIPNYANLIEAYIKAAREFSKLENAVKQKYSPHRQSGETEGYELGVEWFQDRTGNWQIDDKKASYYAMIPDNPKNKWPIEINLQTSYLALAELIFKTGKILLKFIGLDEKSGIQHQHLLGYGRMLHYLKENDLSNDNPYWCGAHFDHGIFTGLIPAHYFKNADEVMEPEEAGLHITPSQQTQFEKIHANDKSVLLFQVGEFGQLTTHDRIKATKHLVKKAFGNIERFAFALFFVPDSQTIIHSNSQLRKDSRYAENQAADGSITFAAWHNASLERYLVKNEN